MLEQLSDLELNDQFRPFKDRIRFTLAKLKNIMEIMAKQAISDRVDSMGHDHSVNVSLSHEVIQKLVEELDLSGSNLEELEITLMNNQLPNQPVIQGYKVTLDGTPHTFGVVTDLEMLLQDWEEPDEVCTCLDYLLGKGDTLAGLDSRGTALIRKLHDGLKRIYSNSSIEEVFKDCLKTYYKRYYPARNTEQILSIDTWSCATITKEPSSRKYGLHSKPYQLVFEYDNNNIWTGIDITIGACNLKKIIIKASKKELGLSVEINEIINDQTDTCTISTESVSDKGPLKVEFRYVSAPSRYQL